MANVKFTNFARSKLTVGLSAVDTTIVVTGGTGALFPSLSAGQYFYATIENSLLVREIVKVTARTGDTFTVTRGQDNTTAVTWNAADNISLRFTAAAITDTLNSAAQQTSPTGTLVLPSGTTAERFDTIGFRYNTTLPRFEGYNGTTWSGIALAGANADITSLTALTAGGLPDNSVLTADIADAQVTPAKMSQPLTAGTAVSVSGSSSIPFTGIPSWVNRITFIMSGISTGGVTNYQLQVGAGSFAASGYASAYSNIDGTNTTATGSATTSFVMKTSVGAANTYSGIAVLTRVSGNTWVCASQVNSNSGVSTTQSGTITLGGTLDRVQITADTFDAGSVNILYE